MNTRKHAPVTICPLCGKPIKQVFTTYTCTNSACAFDHGMMTLDEFRAIGDAIKGAYEQALDAVCAQYHIDGNWPINDLRRAFAAGATWWEFEKTGATMWQSDQRKAETEAEKRYSQGTKPVSPARLSPADEADEVAKGLRGNRT